MHPYVIDQLAEDRWQQLAALSRPRHTRSARATVGSLLISWGVSLLSPPEEAPAC